MINRKNMKISKKKKTNNEFKNTLAKTRQDMAGSRGATISLKESSWHFLIK